MTSHFDNQCRKDWLGSFQPPLSPHITSTLHCLYPSISHCCSCSLCSCLCLIHIPPSVYPLSSFIHHITHHAFLWRMLALHLFALAQYIISINDSTLGFFLLYCPRMLFMHQSVLLSIFCPSQICWDENYTLMCLSSPTHAQKMHTHTDPFPYVIKFSCLLY